MHQGQWLRDRIRALTTVTALAAKAGVSREVLNKYFALETIDGRPDVVRAILQAIGVPDAELQPKGTAGAMKVAIDDLVRAASVAQGGRPGADPLVQAMVANAIAYFGDLPQEAVANVDPYSEKRIQEEVPVFDLSVAAGTWIDVSDNQDGDGQHVTLAQMKQGLFRVRIRGTSMEPRFPDGSLLEFRIKQTPDGYPNLEALVPGQCYYIQLNDGRATFKLFDDRDLEGGIVLRALNPTMKKTRLVASPLEVVRIACFEHMLTQGAD